MARCSLCRVSSLRRTRGKFPGTIWAHLAASLAFQHTLQAAPQVAQQLCRQLGLQLRQRTRAAAGRQRQQQLQQRRTAAVIAQAVQWHTCRGRRHQQAALSKAPLSVPIPARRAQHSKHALAALACLQKHPGPALRHAPACAQAAAGCLAARQSTRAARQSRDSSEPGSAVCTRHN